MVSDRMLMLVYFKLIVDIALCHMSVHWQSSRTLCCLPSFCHEFLALVVCSDFLVSKQVCVDCGFWQSSFVLSVDE